MEHPAVTARFRGSPAMTIALACDDNYAMPMATALRSIVDANDARPIEFHLLTDGLCEESKRKIEQSICGERVCVRWNVISLGRFAHLRTLANISRMTFARLLLAEVLPPHIPRVLYLDTDVLVLGNLDSLWDTDLAGAPVGAVVDGMEAQIKSGARHLAAVPRVERYFNAGMLLIDLQAWRQARICDRALNYLNSNPHTPFADQDALNVACDGAWQRLDETWNCQSHLQTDFASMDPAARPEVLHFVTSRKPWIPASLNPHHAFYDGFRKRTAFARSPRQRAVDLLSKQWALAKQRALRIAVVRGMRDWRRGCTHVA